MLGAVGAAVLLDTTGLGFWAALPVITVAMFVFGVLMERLFVQWLLRLDPLYNFLLTFGITLFLVDIVKNRYGVSSLPYQLPAGLEGRLEVAGVSLSTYQIFVAVFSLVVCLLVWMLLT